MRSAVLVVENVRVCGCTRQAATGGKLLRTAMRLMHHVQLWILRLWTDVCWTEKTQFMDVLLVFSKEVTILLTNPYRCKVGSGTEVLVPADLGNKAQLLK